MRGSRFVRITAPATLVVTLLLGLVGTGAAHATVRGQTASGPELATKIRTKWWPEARASIDPELGLETLALRKVRCPKSVPTVARNSESTLMAALSDLAAGDVAPGVRRNGVFTCVGNVDGQRLLVGGAVGKAGDAHFATASLLLSPAALAEVVTTEFANQGGGAADVECSSRAVLITQPDVVVRCQVSADDGTRGVAEVVLDAEANITSVDFIRK